ncbi:TPA: hypothetical protein OQU49_004333 [Shigella flexneri]|nr:hypothetical protein [Shigella flexneri]
MSNTRDLTIRLNAGEAESLDLGEIHLIIATHSPREGARDIFRTIACVAPSEIASDQPIPHDAFLALLQSAQTAIRDAKESR